MLGVTLELAVRNGSLLQGPDAPDPVVRLPEHAEPEQADRDEQHRGAHERDQQLGVDLGRQTADGRTSGSEPPLRGRRRSPVRPSLLATGGCPASAQGARWSIRPPCW